MNVDKGGLSEAMSRNCFTLSYMDQTILSKSTSIVEECSNS